MGFRFGHFLPIDFRQSAIGKIGSKLVIILCVFIISGQVAKSNFCLCFIFEFAPSGILTNNSSSDADITGSSIPPKETTVVEL